MSTIKTKDGVEIFYKDWGKGRPIVFSHGWPLSSDDWDNQMLFFLSKGYRVMSPTPSSNRFTRQLLMQYQHGAKCTHGKIHT
jgi:pimeloyl-ACP methyl ester carboxylesterase